MKTMKTIVIVIALVCGLIACSKYVKPEHIEWANKVCAGNGGLKVLEVKHVGTLMLFPNAICNNGAKFISYKRDYNQNNPGD